MPGLTIRKLADRSVPRIKRFNPDTGEAYLADPITGQAAPYPSAGVRLEVAPDKVRVSTTVINDGVAEGWITLEDPKPVTRPAGATPDQWISPHTGTPHFFVHASAVVFHTVDGTIRYKVVHQPDKYADHEAASYEIKAFKGGDNVKVTPEIYEAGATRVDHFYDLVKES